MSPWIWITHRLFSCSSWPAQPFFFPQPPPPVRDPHTTASPETSPVTLSSSKQTMSSSTSDQSLCARQTAVFSYAALTPPSEVVLEHRLPSVLSALKVLHSAAFERDAEAFLSERRRLEGHWPSSDLVDRISSESVVSVFPTELPGPPPRVFAVSDQLDGYPPKSFDLHQSSSLAGHQAPTRQEHRLRNTPPHGPNLSTFLVLSPRRPHRRQVQIP